MKRVLLVMVMLSVFGCANQCTPTAWFLAAPDVDTEDNVMIGRVGLKNSDGIEFGLESQYLGVKGTNQSYGAYAVADVNVVPLGTQYIGAHASIIDTDDDGALYGPVAGVTTVIAPNVEAVVEGQFNAYQDNLRELLGTDDELVGYVGIKIKFK